MTMQASGKEQMRAVLGLDVQARSVQRFKRCSTHVIQQVPEKIFFPPNLVRFEIEQITAHISYRVLIFRIPFLNGA